MKRRLNQLTQKAVEHGLFQFYGSITKNIILTQTTTSSMSSVQLGQTKMDRLEVIFIIYVFNITFAFLTFIGEILWHLIKKN